MDMNGMIERFDDYYSIMIGDYNDTIAGYDIRDYHHIIVTGWLMFS